MTTYKGTFLEPLTIPEGSQATAAVAVGGTVIPVKNLNNFLDAGGRCQIGESDETTAKSYSYTLDETTSSLILSSALTVAVEEGQPIYSLSDNDRDESLLRALIRLDDDGDPIPATLASGLRLEDLDAALLAGTEVTLESTDEGWRIVALDYELPAINRAVLRTPLISLTLSANQSIPDSTPNTLLTGWGGAAGTKAGLYGRFRNEIMVRGGSDGVDITVPGAYLIIATVDWTSNSSGGRTSNLSIERGGVEVDATQSAGPPAPGGRSTQQVSRLFVAEGNETVKVTVSQSSGASLNVRTVFTSLQVMQVAMT